MKKQKLLLSFGRKIRALRERQGLTQEQLAEKTGVHRTYVGMIERGEKNITLGNIQRLAKALKVRVADLFSDE